MRFRFPFATLFLLVSQSALAGNLATSLLTRAAQQSAAENEFILAEVQDGLKVAARTRHFKYKPEVAQKISDSIIRWAHQLDLEPLLLLAVMTQESHFAPNLVSNAHAVGLMQIEPRTVSNLCKTENWKCPKTRRELFDPERNVEFGARILNHQFECTQNFLAALASYNQGCHGVQMQMQQGQTSWAFSGLVMTHYSNLIGRFYAKYPNLAVPGPPLPAALRAHPGADGRPD